MKFNIPVPATLCLLALFCSSPRKGKAQTNELKFQIISGSSGISLGKINSITQDCFGFIWLSDQTNKCITRFDGNSMKRFQYKANDTTGLGGPYPEVVVAAPDSNLWIGFYGQGLDKFNLLTNTFTHYKHNPKDLNSLGSDSVTSIVYDHLGNVWVGTYRGLDLLNKETGTFKHFAHRDDDPTSISCNKVRCVYEDRSGTIWVGTGFAFDFVQEGGLNRLDRETGKFTRYMHEPGNPNSLINDKVRAILEDSQGNFWVGTMGDGLHTMDRETGLFTRHRYDPNHPERLSRPPVNPNDSYEHITFLTEDAEGQIWIGTSSSGVNRFDPVTKTIKHFGNDPDVRGMFKDNSGWCAYPAQDGSLWLSTQQQSTLYRIYLYNNQIPRYIDKDGLYAIYDESDSISWYGTRKGLIRKNEKNGKIRRFLIDPSDPYSQTENLVYQITQDHEKILWLSGHGGLIRFDPVKDSFTRYVHDPSDSTSLSQNIVMDIHEDHDFNLWVATFGGGLERFDRSTGRFIHYRHDPTDNTSIVDDIVNQIVEDKDHDLLLATSGGISKMHKETQTFTHNLLGITVHCLYKDHEDRYWASSINNGFYRSDDGAITFSDVYVNAGIISIMEDDNGELWMASTKGVVEYDPDRNHIFLYDDDNGVIGDYLNDFNRIYKRRNGELIFTNLNAHYSVYPDRLKRVIDTSRLYFTNFILKGQTVRPNPDGPLQKPLIIADRINLNYDQNSFSIGFTEIDFSMSENNQILYRLEPYDNDWRQTNAESPVTYFKVPPGSYVFRIKATHGDSGIWSEKSMAIAISPPWWRTWWAYTMFSFILVMGVYQVHSFQRTRVIQKERERTRETELAQAKEIEKAYKELKNTQSQLIQSEKMASLGELTAGIAHEIQNPLNFVNNFSEVNTELAGELLDAVARGDLSEVQSLAKSIRENEDKISSHGKRADGIVKSMLQHSRAGSGRKELTDINALCDEYLRLAYHGLRAKDKSFNATFKTDLDPSLPKAEVVPQDIGRVILNLINNAFQSVSEKAKANGAGYEPQVTMSTNRAVDGIHIKVRDNGTGIPDSIKEKIFQPFFTTKPTGQGTGLGLSLSYDIVKALGGSIDLNTKEGYGTEFTIKLPMG
jgi:signal transduction histidine kinase/ligand-binding sensor domain-containing protein